MMKTPNLQLLSQSKCSSSCTLHFHWLHNVLVDHNTLAGLPPLPRWPEVVDVKMKIVILFWGTFIHVSSAAMCSYAMPCYRARVVIALYIIKCFWQEWSENTLGRAHPHIKSTATQSKTLCKDTLITRSRGLASQKDGFHC